MFNELAKTLQFQAKKSHFRRSKRLEIASTHFVLGTLLKSHLGRAYLWRFRGRMFLGNRKKFLAII